MATYILTIKLLVVADDQNEAINATGRALTLDGFPDYEFDSVSEVDVSDRHWQGRHFGYLTDALALATRH